MIRQLSPKSRVLPLEVVAFVVVEAEEEFQLLPPGKRLLIVAAKAEAYWGDKLREIADPAVAEVVPGAKALDEVLADGWGTFDGGNWDLLHEIWPVLAEYRFDPSSRE